MMMTINSITAPTPAPTPPPIIAAGSVFASSAGGPEMKGTKHILADSKILDDKEIMHLQILAILALAMYVKKIK